MANIKKINPKTGKRVAELIKELNMTQIEFGKKIGLGSRQISCIVTGKRRLTEDNARRIAELFPPVRFEWLMGWDDYKNIHTELISAINEMNHEGHLLYTGTAAFAELAGYDFSPPNIHGNKSFNEIFTEIKSGCKISKGGETVTMSLDELNQFENEIFDFVELKFKHLFKQKGVKE